MDSASALDASADTYVALYTHIRVILGIVVGLSLTHLLRNLARIVEEPRDDRVYWLHLGWVGFVLLYLLQFWWWEFRFTKTGEIGLGTYLYLISYALLLYLLCAFLFPEKNSDPKNYYELFYLRRQWFFAVLALVFVIDFGDTLLKGGQYLIALGSWYVCRNLFFIAGSLIAIASESRVYHAGYFVIGFCFQLFYFFYQYGSLEI
ncbi:hypothetical protein AWR36_014345 [Microbulbifer flavimaris]|uniref:Uncharacterized protein n=1 Tax=Microbulbifer flavimaris TaxID=1781068 RepID=A0ABX4HW70_9GAMM|nr:MULTISPECIES: hypothetical protein [Microbulbifer]KUJ80191.1 hypothetical protein AVO43_14300 [Microbulbifer sp. ZGT114]PCO04256.1 hypothetical protein AWR36_014345 [Microbulbifer flavimaris]